MQSYDPIEVATQLVKTVYLFNSCGGNLHIVVDDYNIEDEHLTWCRRCIEENPLGSPPLQLEVERVCLSALETLTVDERMIAIGGA